MMRLVGIWLTMMGFISAASGQKIAELKAAAFPSNGPAPLTVSFTAEGLPRAETPDWEEYHWDFGDNLSAKGAKTTHTYQITKKYKVTVICKRRVSLRPAYYLQLTQTLTITVAAPPRPQAPPRLQVTPTNLDFQTVEGSDNSSPTSVVVNNIGGGRFVWSVSNNSPNWLVLSPTNGTLAGGQGTKIGVQAVTAGLAAGTYQATLTFTTRGNLNTSMIVNARLVVARRPAPPVNPAVVTPAPSEPRNFPWWLLGVPIVLTAGLMLARKVPKRKRAQKTMPEVKLNLGRGVQKVEADAPLLSSFLRIRVRWDSGSQRVPTQTLMIGKITKSAQPRP